MNDLLLSQILLVDDKKANLIALEAVLERCGAKLFTATSGNEALALMLEHTFALVLLDVQMPDMDGYEVAELMRQNPDTQDIPIIFVTAINKEKSHVFKGYESGAVDYLYKPVEPSILLSKISIFIKLWEKNARLRETVAELEAANQTILTQQEELRQLAIHDHLTGMYQRRWFDEMIEKAVAFSIRNNVPLTLAMLDIDHFKSINDNYGHDVGDRVLVQLAQVLAASVRTSDAVFRYGGEEFAILLPNTDRLSAADVCERIRQNIAERPFNYDGGQLSITLSGGIAELLELEIQTPKNLLICADGRLYHAKLSGRNRICDNGC